ncbi:MAG TPA: hypothetical protein PLY16_01505, partial [Candidatus Saccharibacteria bacterium]|nr:hypothetical protein [Candidatus Saccharibacteria bacterium]
NHFLLQEGGPESLGVELVLTAPRSATDSILHTQRLTVWELGILQGEFRKKHSSAELNTLGLRSFLTLLLIKRIKEARPRSSSFLLNRGKLLIPLTSMRVADNTRGREKSIKGIIYSSDGRLILDTHPAHDWPEDAGIGLTARIE